MVATFALATMCLTVNNVTLNLDAYSMLHEINNCTIQCSNNQYVVAHAKGTSILFSTQAGAEDHLASLKETWTNKVHDESVVNYEKIVRSCKNTLPLMIIRAGAFAAGAALGHKMMDYMHQRAISNSKISVKKK